MEQHMQWNNTRNGTTHAMEQPAIEQHTMEQKKIQRKIQLTGGSTHIVSLPGSWIRKNKLKKGSTVKISESEDGSLIIRTEEPAGKDTEIRIEQQMDQEYINRLIITKYIQGYTTIKLTSKEHIPLKTRKGVKKISQMMIGLEVFGEESNELDLYVLIKEDVDVEKSINQMFNISISSLNELINCIELCTKDTARDILRDIIQRDDEVDKFYFLVLRGLYMTANFKNMALKQIAKSIERISDHIENIAELLTDPLQDSGRNSNIDSGRYSIPRDISETYSRLPDIYKRLRAVSSKRDPVVANKIIEELDFMISIEKEHINNAINENPDPHLILTLGSLNRINRYMADIAEAVINMS